MNQFDSLHLAMFSGKGGVGKTTLACTFARRWAHQFPQESILLLSTDPAHSLGDVLKLSVTETAQAITDLPNLQVRSLNAEVLLQDFKARYGTVLELLVERGSFVQEEDLTPVWDLSWPGLDELMSILEIQRVLREQEASRVVVDMAPSGHTLNLFGLMDFLDEFLGSLELFQEKHRVISQTLVGHYNADEADGFLQSMNADLSGGRQLLQDSDFTACLVVAIAEPMSFLETDRFVEALDKLHIPVGGVFVNHILKWVDEPSAGEKLKDAVTSQWLDRYTEQCQLLTKFANLVPQKPLLIVPQQADEPVGEKALDQLLTQIRPYQPGDIPKLPLLDVTFPVKIPPSFTDFIAEGRRLILVGGKGGVGKTTVAGAIAWGMAQAHPDRNIRVISIDPAHSLGDAFGQTLGNQPQAIAPNLTGQEVDAEEVLEQFREDYLWELADMMSGESKTADSTLKVAYGPEAWRRIVSQALPGIDEMLSLVTVMELLESHEQDLIILDTAPTGHLLRFLEMPTALGDWLAWIFKLWIKYQDVLGKTDFMGRLRTLRQRVMKAQKKLKDPQHTEFIGVALAQSAVLAEAQRLTASLEKLEVNQRYIVLNRYESGQPVPSESFPQQTILRLPVLPRSVLPLIRIEGAANLLF